VREGGEGYLRFVGKKGVDLDLHVADAKAAKILTDRAARAGKDRQIFANVSDSSLRDYVHELDGGKFKTKDFRTLLGTRAATEKMRSVRAPSSEKEYKSAVKEVATHVSRLLGNTPTVALQSYIHPAVFAPWRARL
jgi:DNA topoisomerase-1